MATVNPPVDAQERTKQEKLWESKKGQFALLVLVLATALFAFFELPADAYQGIIVADVVAYIGGNVGEYFAGRQ